MPKSILQLRQFNGLVKSAEKLGDPQSIVDGKNFMLNDDRTLRKSFGTKKIIEGHSLNNITDLFLHDDDTDLSFALGQSSLKVHDGGSWAQIATPTVDSIDFTSYLKDVYYFYGDNSKYYDVSAKTVVDLDTTNETWFLANGGTAANYISVRGHSPVVHLNKLWIPGNDEYNNSVLFTQSFNNLFYDLGTGNLPFLQFVSVGGDGSPSGSVDDKITRVVTLGATLYALKKKSFHQLYGLGSNQFRFESISNSIGCQFPRSVQVTRSGIIFMEDGNKGIWLFNGSFRNISRGRIDDTVRSISGWVRSSVIKSRFYKLSWENGTLMYDIELDSWSFIEQSYGALFQYMGAANKYTTTTTTVTDPQRPTEPQSVLLRTADSTDIVRFDVGGALEIEADTSDQSDLDFEVKTALIDFGNISLQKSVYEVVVQVLTAEPELYMDVNIDGKVIKNLKGTFDPRSLYNRSYYFRDEYREIKRYPVKFLLPMSATGYSFQFTIRSNSQYYLSIDSISIFHRLRGINGQEKT